MDTMDVEDEGVALGMEDEDEDEEVEMRVEDGKGVLPGEEEEEEKMVELEGLREELVKSINSAQMSSKADDKISFLTQVKEIVFHRDSTKSLLKEFVGDICDFQTESNPKLRMFVVEFFEEACKSSEDVIPTIIPKLLYIMQDSNANVLKRGLLAVNNLYRPALMLACKPSFYKSSEDDGRVKELCEAIEGLRKRSVKLLDSKNLVVSMTAIRVVQTISLSYMAPDASGTASLSGRKVTVRSTTGPDAFTLLDVPDGHPVFLKPKLEQQGKSMVELLINSLEELPQTKQAATRGVLISNALANLALHRPSVRKPIIELLVNLGHSLADSQVMLKLAQAVKTHLLGLLKVKEQTIQTWSPKIVDALKALGAEDRALKVSSKVTKELEHQKRKRAREEAKEKPKAAATGLSAIAFSVPELTRFDYGQALRIRSLTVERMIELDSEMGFSSEVSMMLARLVCDFSHRSKVKIYDEEKEESKEEGTAKSKKDSQTQNKATEINTNHSDDEDDEMDNSEERLMQLVDLRPMAMKHVSESLSKRLSLALAMLYHEYTYDVGEFSKVRAAPSYPAYDRMFERFLDIAREEGTGQDEKLLTKLLVGVPRLTENAFRLVFDLCVSDDRKDRIVGLSTLRDLIATRQSVRDRCVSAVLYFGVHSIAKVRVLAIHLIRTRIYPDHPDLQQRIKEFGINMINTLLPSSEDDSNPDQVEAVNAKLAPEVLNKPETGPNAEGGEDDNDDGDTKMDEGDSATKQQQEREEWEKQDITRRLALLVALAKIETDLVKTIAEIYGANAGEKGNVKVLEVCHNMGSLKELLQSLGKSLGPGPALKLFNPVPNGASALVVYDLQLLSDPTICTTSENARALLSEVQALKSKDDGAYLFPQDIRFVIPVIGWMDRGRIEEMLPRILGMEDIVVKTAMHNLLHSSMEGLEVPFTPTQLLGKLVRFPPSPELSVAKLVYATETCLADKNNFTQDVLIQVIGELLLEPELPLLTMRIIIRSQEEYPRLKTFIVDVLSNLLERQIWRHPDLWEGFIRCAKELKTPAYPILLRLPAEQLDMVFEKHPDLFGPLAYFLKQNKEEYKYTLPREVLAVFLKRKDKDTELGLTMEAIDEAQAPSILALQQQQQQLLLLQEQLQQQPELFQPLQLALQVQQQQEQQQQHETIEALMPPFQQQFNNPPPPEHLQRLESMGSRRSRHSGGSGRHRRHRSYSRSLSSSPDSRRHRSRRGRRRRRSRSYSRSYSRSPSPRHRRRRHRGSDRDREHRRGPPGGGRISRDRRRREGGSGRRRY